MPENDEMDVTRREVEQKGNWYRLIHCSICLRFIWFRSIVLKEPIEAPEPHREWTLCKECYEALLIELKRSSLRTSVRLRIAMGLVAAERSPKAYTMNPAMSEQQEFQREFAWGIRLLIFFALLHLVVFAVIFAVPK